MAAGLLWPAAETGMLAHAMATNDQRELAASRWGHGAMAAAIVGGTGLTVLTGVPVAVGAAATLAAGGVVSIAARTIGANRYDAEQAQQAVFLTSETAGRIQNPPAGQVDEILRLAGQASPTPPTETTTSRVVKRGEGLARIANAPEMRALRKALETMMMEEGRPKPSPATLDSLMSVTMAAHIDPERNTRRDINAVEVGQTVTLNEGWLKAMVEQFRTAEKLNHKNQLVGIRDGAKNLEEILAPAATPPQAKGRSRVATAAGA